MADIQPKHLSVLPLIFTILFKPQSNLVDQELGLLFYQRLNWCESASREYWCNFCLSRLVNLWIRTEGTSGHVPDSVGVDISNEGVSNGMDLMESLGIGETKCVRTGADYWAVFWVEDGADMMGELTFEPPLIWSVRCGLECPLAGMTGAYIIVERIEICNLCKEGSWVVAERVKV